MSIKTDLRVALYAGEVLVAESIDPILWQRNLSVISGSSNEFLEQSTFSRDHHSGIDEKDTTLTRSEIPRSPDDRFIKFANDLDINLNTVHGACGPSLESPYLHLDYHAWETFRNSNPSRGAGAIAAPALAGTLLSLWFMNADLGIPSIPMIKSVLKTINIEDKNIPRGVRNCEWLQLRGSNLIVNPAKIAKAKSVAKAFCIQKPIDSEEWL
jgi:hypothetical protein